MAQNIISNEPAIFGSAFATLPDQARSTPATSSTHLRATIVRINPDKGKCDVFGEGCYFSDVALPGMSLSVGGAGGTFDVPKNGTPVLVRVTGGLPTIAQILAIPNSPESETRPRYPIAETQTSTSFYPDDDGPTYGQTPLGMLPGDWCKMGEDGQCFAVLDGGAVKMRATPLAQIEASRINDTLNVVGRNLNLFSGFGKMRFADDGGKSAFLFEGGTDQMTQTGGPLEKWQVRARIGGDAEGLADFQLLGFRGERLFSAVLDGDGSIRQYRAGDTNASYGGNLTEEIYNGFERTVRTGNHDLYLNDGNRNDYIVGNDDLKLFGSKSTMIAGSRNDNVRNRWTASVGRTATFNISGDSIPTSLSKALSFIVANGSVVFDIGNPLAGDLQSATSSFRVLTKSAGGQIELRSGNTGFTWIDSDNPAGSVMIGGNIIKPATEPAVLGLQMLKLLADLAAKFDSHVHPLTVVGSNPVVTVNPLSGRTLSPQSPTVASSGPKTISKKVLVGA